MQRKQHGNKVLVEQPPCNSAYGFVTSIGSTDHLDHKPTLYSRPTHSGKAEPRTPEQSYAHMRAETAGWAEVILAVVTKLDLNYVQPGHSHYTHWRSLCPHPA
jgi:hypothetical protein